MAAIFHNPGRDNGVSDYAIYQQDMRLALSAESLGYELVWVLNTTSPTTP